MNAVSAAGRAAHHRQRRLFIPIDVSCKSIAKKSIDFPPASDRPRLIQPSFESTDPTPEKSV
jgi:hypothetical protein